MKRVIINADDFGLSPGVNRGILDAFRHGILTSTTMLVNLAGFDEAVELARQNPDLPVGIHLSLLWGAPVSAPSTVPSLVESNGHFPRSLGVLARRYFLRTLNLDDVRREFLAQIERFRQAGLNPSHVDTHKHVHCLPGVLDTLTHVVDETGIRRLRFPHEDGLQNAGGVPVGSWKARARARSVSLLLRNGREALARRGLRTTDHFTGIEHQDRLDGEVLRFILSHLKDGVTELMCHPGYDDAPAREYSRTPPHRDQELAALQDPAVRDCLIAQRIQRVSYNDL
jgi:hopanoid biosynthesis associated protein HpnK